LNNRKDGEKMNETKKKSLVGAKTYVVVALIIIIFALGMMELKGQINIRQYLATRKAVSITKEVLEYWKIGDYDSPKKYWMESYRTDNYTHPYNLSEYKIVNALFHKDEAGWTAYTDVVVRMKSTNKGGGLIEGLWKFRLRKNEPDKNWEVLYFTQADKKFGAEDDAKIDEIRKMVQEMLK
jgi:hypothetical protein